MTLVEAGTPLKSIQVRQGPPIHSIELTAHLAVTKDGHRKRPQVVETGTREHRFTKPTGSLKTTMVGLATLQGAVNKQQGLLFLHFASRLLIMMATANLR
jgi:hypothetical protein